MNSVVAVTGARAGAGRRWTSSPIDARWAGATEVTRVTVVGNREFSATEHTNYLGQFSFTNAQLMSEFFVSSVGILSNFYLKTC